MPSAVAWNGDVVTVAVPDQRQAAARNQTTVPVRPEHFARVVPLWTSFADAVQAAIGDPGATVTVDQAHVIVHHERVWQGAWHADTPWEWAEALDVDDRQAVREAVALSLLDDVLDWEPGWPPEMEGW